MSFSTTAASDGPIPSWRSLRRRWRSSSLAATIRAREPRRARWCRSAKTTTARTSRGLAAERGPRRRTGLLAATRPPTSRSPRRRREAKTASSSCETSAEKPHASSASPTACQGPRHRHLGTQFGDERRGEGNGAARRSGLGFREDPAAVSALGAVGAALVAAHRHLARSRAAPVLPRTALEGAFDAEDPGVEINVASEQAERLASAEPE